MRRIDQKFHIEDNKIIKTSSGEVVPEDEPLILFRARDYLALTMLDYYRVLCIADGCTGYQLEKLDAVIADFQQYTVDHPEMMKQPGITKGMPFIPKEKQA
jgi:hypothetical protein